MRLNQTAFRWCGVWLCVVLVGCTTGLTTNSGGSAGSAVVSGTVLVSEADLSQIGVTSNISSISSAHISSLDTVGIRNATQLPSGTGEIYIVNSDGTVEYTGKTFTVTDGHFDVTGLDPTKMYVAQVKAVGTNSAGQEKAIVLKAVIVFDAEGKATITVSETTKVAADYVLSRVVGGGGSGMTSDASESLQKEVVDTYIQKLGDGDINRVSPVVDADQITSGVVGEKKEWQMASGARTIVEAVDDSSDVRKLKNQTVAESKAKEIESSSGSIEDAKFIVRQIFGVNV